MNEALEWALGKSEASGAERAVLFAIARRAEGCTTRCATREILAEARIGKRLYYECMVALGKIGEVERIPVARYMPLREFHFKKLCNSLCALSVDCGKRPSQIIASLRSMCTDPILRFGGVACGKLKAVENDSRKEFTARWKQVGLFSDALTEREAREVCEECGGAGIRLVKREGGQEFAVKCGHVAARIVGRWGLAECRGAEEFLWRKTSYSLGPKPVPWNQLPLKVKG